METTEDKIRCIKIIVTANIATRACHPNAGRIETALKLALSDLLSLDRVLSDAKHQLERTGAALGFKETREARIRSVVLLVVHAEAFAAMNGLQPILSTLHYPMEALLKSGIFNGKTTLMEFASENDENQFSDKELSILAGFLGESCDELDFFIRAKVK